MSMKRYMLTLFIMFLISTVSFCQNWNPFNDTLVYYFQDSNSGDYHTLRTEEKTIGVSDTTITFIDNYIPIDTLDHRFLFDQGSVFGKLLEIKGDTLTFNDEVMFLNSMEIGETLPFSVLEETFITYDSIAYTLVFEIMDSVKYYSISDGRSVEQSKNFGFLKFPKQNSELLIEYDLVGIEGVIGMSFNHHNEFFDFEIGDQFFYMVGFGNWIDGDTKTYWKKEKMVVHNKFLIGDLFYYAVSTHGGDEDYLIYPPIYEDNTDFDYPGERVIYCRANDLYYSSWMDYILEDQTKFAFEQLGHRYVLSEEGRLVQTIGDDVLLDSYDTFGWYSPTLSGYGINYRILGDTIAAGTAPDDYYLTYEEGVGLNHFQWNGHEQVLFKYLYAAIKSTDTLGTYDLSIPESELLMDLNVFPNPTTEIIHLPQEIKNILIISSNGKVLMNFQAEQNYLDVRDLPAGKYQLFGIDIEGRRRYSQFIKI